MQIVIDIPDEIYNLCATDDYFIYHETDIIRQAIKNGTQLPKGHGKLIDANKFLKNNEAYTGWILNSSDWGGENVYKDTLEDLVNEAPTVVEADMEE